MLSYEFFALVISFIGLIISIATYIIHLRATRKKTIEKKKEEDRNKLRRVIKEVVHEIIRDQVDEEKNKIKGLVLETLTQIEIQRRQ